MNFFGSWRCLCCWFLVAGQGLRLCRGCEANKRDFLKFFSFLVKQISLLMSWGPWDRNPGAAAVTGTFSLCPLQRQLWHQKAAKSWKFPPWAAQILPGRTSCWFFTLSGACSDSHMEFWLPQSRVWMSLWSNPSSVLCWVWRCSLGNSSTLVISSTNCMFKNTSETWFLGVFKGFFEEHLPSCCL